MNREADLHNFSIFDIFQFMQIITKEHRELQKSIVKTVPMTHLADLELQYLTATQCISFFLSVHMETLTDRLSKNVTFNKPCFTHFWGHNIDLDR